MFSKILTNDKILKRLRRWGAQEIFLGRTIQLWPLASQPSMIICCDCQQCIFTVKDCDIETMMYTKHFTDFMLILRISLLVIEIGIPWDFVGYVHFAGQQVLNFFWRFHFKGKRKEC